MAKAELWKPGLRTVLGSLGSFPVRRGEGDVEALGDRDPALPGRAGAGDVPRGDPATQGTAQEAPASPPHRNRADRARGGRPAAAGRDRGHGPALETSARQRSLRRPRPAGRSGRHRPSSCRPGGDGAALGGDSAARSGARRRENVSPSTPPPAGSTRPLLAIDGDSLAHRAFHALPKTIKDGSRRPANMIVGFANMLVTLWEAERHETVFVGFDTLTNSTYRNELFPGYQSGRDFAPELVEQLNRLPELVSVVRFRLRQGGRLRGGRLPRGRRPLRDASEAATRSWSRAIATPFSSRARR